MNRGLAVLLLIALFCGIVYADCKTQGCPAGNCCSKWGYCGNTNDHCVKDCHSLCNARSTTGSSTGSTSGGGSSGSCSLSSILTQAKFNELFPKRTAYFNYNALITAAKSYPKFSCVGDLKTRRREVAAFLAQTSQETSGSWDTAPDRYSWGYIFAEEQICVGKSCCAGYCYNGKSYHGRGPMQISHHYNYGPAGRAIGADLLGNPGLVLSNNVIGFKTALWFWMTAQSPKPSCHAVMTGGYKGAAGRPAGFGMTTNIINGGLECAGRQPAKVANRIGYLFP